MSRKSKKIFYIFIQSIILFTAIRTLAFPDMIRHGYVNCTTCHVSPSGGGLINSYGRSLSKELLSTWSYENEEQLFHGLVEIPKETMDKFLVGGDVRYLSKPNLDKEPSWKDGFLMQAQLRLGVVFDKIKLISTIGKISNPRKSSEVELVSPEYYALISPADGQFLRIGRFEPQFGLRLPDHNLWVRSEAGLNPRFERDIIEVTQENENSTFVVAGFQSTQATLSAQQSTGFTASWYQTFDNRFRIGTSVLKSEGQGIRTSLNSLHATLGYTSTTYTHLEWLRSSTNGNDREAMLMRTGHEFSKGFIPIIQAQSRRSIDQSSSSQLKYGGGFFWFPRPHFEIMTLLEEFKTDQTTDTEATVMLHYYF